MASGLAEAACRRYPPPAPLSPARWAAIALITLALGALFFWIGYGDGMDPPIRSPRSSAALALLGTAIYGLWPSPDFRSLMRHWAELSGVRQLGIVGARTVMAFLMFTILYRWFRGMPDPRSTLPWLWFVLLGSGLSQLFLLLGGELTLADVALGVGFLAVVAASIVAVERSVPLALDGSSS